MKSMFLKEPERNHEMFIRSLKLAGRGSPGRCICCENEYIPVVADRETYLKKMSDDGILWMMRNVSDRLGIDIDLSSEYIRLEIYFRYGGLRICKGFYGEMRRQLAQRLQFEFGNMLLLDAGAEEVYIGPERESIKVIDDDDFLSEDPIENEKRGIKVIRDEDLLLDDRDDWDGWF